jgi:hypothetical protein
MQSNVKLRTRDTSLIPPSSDVGHWIKDEDRDRFHSDGYMVIRNVLPASLIGNAIREITAFLGADLHDSSTWYRNAPQNDGIVPLHHAQSLWDIRQCANLFATFSEFWRTRRLMVDINRCIFRPPCRMRSIAEWQSTHYLKPNMLKIDDQIVVTGNLT